VAGANIHNAFYDGLERILERLRFDTRNFDHDFPILGVFRKKSSQGYDITASIKDGFGYLKQFPRNIRNEGSNPDP